MIEHFSLIHLLVKLERSLVAHVAVLPVFKTAVFII